MNFFSNFPTLPEPEPDAQKWLFKTFTTDLISSSLITGSNNLICFDNLPINQITVIHKYIE